MATKNKSFIVLSIIILISLLFACGGGQTEYPDDEREEPAEQEEPAEETEREDSPGPVAILIVDEFSLNVPQTTQDPTAACPMTPSGQMHAGSRGMTFSGLMHAGSRGMGIASDSNGNPFPHGLLVYWKFWDLFRTADYIEVDKPDLDWIGWIDAWKVLDKYPNIYLVPIDTEGYHTEIIEERIRETIATLENPPWNIRRFVLNMSFGVVPCNIDSTDEFQDYVEAIGDDPGLENLQELLYDLMKDTGDNKDHLEVFIDRTLTRDMSPEAQLEYALGIGRIVLAYRDRTGELTKFAQEMEGNRPDPIYSIFTDPISPDTRVIGVASSGNSAKKYPFAPGMWDNVISVSTPPVTENDEVILYYANDGEVMMNGVFEDVVGTSFAAPELSYEAAIYLLKGGFHYQADSGILTCSGDSGHTTPPLTYAGSGGPWSNLELNKAAEAYCTDFLWPVLVEQPEFGERVEIRWFVGLGTGTYPDQIEIQESVVEAFNASHPNIELILEVVPYDSARDTLSTQIAAGNGPDIVGPVGVSGSNNFYGQWLDLTPLINATNYDLSAFNPALVDFYRTEQGQIGLPFVVFPSALYYQCTENSGKVSVAKNVEMRDD